VWPEPRGPRITQLAHAFEFAFAADQPGVRERRLGELALNLRRKIRGRNQAVHDFGDLARSRIHVEAQQRQDELVDRFWNVLGKL
jgi:hypothetical protein